jgi:hypothetical protein
MEKFAKKFNRARASSSLNEDFEIFVMIESEEKCELRDEELDRRRRTK